MDRRLSTFSSSVLAVLVAALAFLAVETCVRLCWQPQIIGEERYVEFTPDFGYGYREALPVFVPVGKKLVVFSTEYRACPRARIYRRKPNNGLRIAALGGSSVGGSNSYVLQLGKLLRAHYPETRVETVNLGAPGFGSYRMRSLLPKALDQKFDILLLDVGGSNEFEDERDMRLYEELHSGLQGIVFQSRAVVLLKKYYRSVTASGQQTQSGQDERQARSVTANRERWREGALKNFEAMILEARQAGAQVVLIGRALQKDEPEKHYIRRTNQAMEDLAGKYNVPYLDVYQRTRRPDGNGDLFRDNGHLSTEGHGLLAKWLEEDALPLIW